MPAKIIARHSFLLICFSVFLYFRRKGNNNKHAKNIRYITMIVEGALDNLTKMADKEIQTIVITSKLFMVFGFI